MTPTRRRVAALAAAAACVAALLPAATAGAATKPAKPSYRVTGRVLAPDGRPLAGARVELSEPVSLLDAFVAIVCVITVVPALAAPDSCFPGTTSAVTDRAGRYTLLVAHGSRLAGESRHELDVVGPRPAGALRGPAIRASYPFHRASRQVADLQLWHGALSATPDGSGRTRVHADPLPARYGERRTLPYVELRARNGTVTLDSGTAFELGPVNGDRDVESRLFEHGTEQLHAYAMGTTADVKVELHAAPVPVRHAGAPLSRGRACWANGPGDLPVGFPGCRFTDGRLGDEVGFHYALAGGKACRATFQCSRPNMLVVDLGAARLVDLVVQRGCDDPCPVEASLDGSTWVALTALESTGAGDDTALAVVPTPARYVRLSYGDIFVWKLRELSVFGRDLPVAPPAAPHPTAPGAPPAVPGTTRPAVPIPAPPALPLPLRGPAHPPSGHVLTLS